VFESGIKPAPAATQPSDAIDLLRQETEFRSRQNDQKSYIDRGVSAVTEFWHKSASSEQQVEQLTKQIQSAVDSGDQTTAARLAGTAKQAVDADQKALNSESTVDHLGSNLLKTVGLFLPGKWSGPIVSGLAYAAGAAKPSDSYGTQALDAGLGAVNGLALKVSFNLINETSMGIAAKAVSLGVTSRFSDSAFSRQTYLNDAGHLDAAAGAMKVLKDTTNLGAVATDVVTFYAAQGILGKINARSGGALNASPFWSTVATGGVFGVTTGGTQEILRQQRAGEKFDIAKVLSSAALNGATDMIAAAPGAKLVSMRAARAESSEPQVARPEKGSERPSLNIDRNFAGSASREYQLVNRDVQVADLLRMSPDKYAYTPVREVNAAGELGPQQNILIQHLDKGVPLNQVLAQKADILATCNPSALPEAFSGKHIMPSAQEGLWLTQAAGGRLRFSMAPENAKSVELGERRQPNDLPGEPKPVGPGTLADNTWVQHGMRLQQLPGTVPDASEFTRFKPTSTTPDASEFTRFKPTSTRTVSEYLLDPQVLQRFRSPRESTDDLAKAMRHFKTPVGRFIDAGKDSIVMELADQQILKITDRPWNEEWGQRTVKTDHGIVRFDNAIIGKPQTIDLPNGTATYYIQQRAQTPVSVAHVMQFNKMIAEDGTYEFWDKTFTDESKHGGRQLGYVPQKNGKRGIFLLDYDAVTYPELVPDGSGQSEDSGNTWTPMHYFEDMRKGRL
jgi:hypothetical protein